MTKPKKCVVTGFVASPASSTVCRADIIATDADGNQWTFPAATFLWDLKPFCEQQELKFTDYESALREAFRYNIPSYASEWLIQQYREGKSVNDVEQILREQRGY